MRSKDVQESRKKRILCLTSEPFFSNHHGLPLDMAVVVTQTGRPFLEERT
jgi:hypothetical protein